MTLLYQELKMIFKVPNVLGIYVSMAKRVSSGSNFGSNIITSDYQKSGNYWQRDDSRGILNEYKSKLNWHHEKF